MSSITTATTFSSSSILSPDSSDSYMAPPPSQEWSLNQPEVPDVFITPPEEENEENPPYCVYDAARESKLSLSLAPDLDALDVALSFTQQTDNRSPAFQRAFGNESQETVIMPRRSDAATPDVPTDVDVRSRSRGLRLSRLLDDDVVEVVKVKRSESATMAGTPGTKAHGLKKSLTFRARASQAFRTIRNVGKGNRKVSGTENIPTRLSGEKIHATTEDGVLASPVTSSLGRKRSVQLSQIFTSVRGPRAPEPDVPMSPTSPTSTSEWSALSRPSISFDDHTNIPIAHETQPDRLTLKGKRPFRRISVRNIQKIFTATPPTSDTSRSLPSPSPSSSPSQESQTVGPTVVASSSRTSLPILAKLDDVFSRSSTRPQSPSISYSQSMTDNGAAEEEAAEEADTTFEMRLDSFHFDSLHFDPDDF